MEGWLLQDWVTIRGTNAGGGPPWITSVAQGADEWLDIGDYEDFVFFLDVREITNSNTKVVYETSPTKLEQDFVPLVEAFTPALGTTVNRVFSTYSAAPPARFVRWRLTCTQSSGNWDLTFRAWVAAYSWVKG